MMDSFSITTLPNYPITKFKQLNYQISALMLFACIHVPDFPVQAALRADAGGRISFQNDSVAVLDGPESLQKVYSCNDRARQAGVEIGMTKLQAEACCGIVLHKRNPEEEDSAQSALLQCAYGFSPRIESTCPGTVIADLSGAGRLLGSAQDMGQHLVSRAAACGFIVNVGLAANADTAMHAARGFADITVIAAGEEAKRLARLPVEVLQPSPEILDTFDSWGIRNFQTLAALPPLPLTQRLGQAGLHLQRLARGEVERELVPAEAPPCFRETLELEESVDLLEPLGFLLNRLLQELLARLQVISLATDYVQLDFELEVHCDRQLKTENASSPATDAVQPLYQRTLKMPVPTQDAKVLLKLLQLDLAAHPPPAPVKKITVEVFPARVRLTQAGLFQPLAPEPAKLEVTLARLRAAVGEQTVEQDETARARVGFPVVMDSHRPDSFQVLPCSSEHKEIRECLPAPRLVLRWFRPPLPAIVECSLARQVAKTNPPDATKQIHHGDTEAQRNQVNQKELGAQTPSPACGPHEEFLRDSNTVAHISEAIPATVIFSGVKAKVVHACGPWRSSGAWWDQARQWVRDEWDVELSMYPPQSTGIYRIFRNAQSGEWFVEGMYD
jgi:protein ImuB